MSIETPAHLLVPLSILLFIAFSIGLKKAFHSLNHYKRCCKTKLTFMERYSGRNSCFLKDHIRAKENSHKICVMHNEMNKENVQCEVDNQLRSPFHCSQQAHLPSSLCS